MKKTLTVNLGGTVYHIDEDAYKLLDTYLSNLRIHFCREEGAEEIVHDMELRISELFTDRLRDGKQVITIEDVEEIIAQMGKPEDLGDEADGGGETSKDGSTYSQTAKGPRRLFRDSDNKVLGGVASGLAAYFGSHMGTNNLLDIGNLSERFCHSIYYCLDCHSFGSNRT